MKRRIYTIPRSWKRSSSTSRTPQNFIGRSSKNIPARLTRIRRRLVWPSWKKRDRYSSRTPRLKLRALRDGAAMSNRDLTPVPMCAFIWLGFEETLNKISAPNHRCRDCFGAGNISGSGFFPSGFLSRQNAEDYQQRSGRRCQLAG
jgi:hypothetical protein